MPGILPGELHPGGIFTTRVIMHKAEPPFPVNEFINIITLKAILKYFKLNNRNTAGKVNQG